ncbi:pyridine nucleotide-disulfide oxidoreductase domain-containing protein 1 [Chelonus insularis]|uniref:pyridine nucleotide-disulfide oxidoreductase domain-containing protein 1 n=1 Tax=Chelonus insularis TaxID=460826 RepID=UPI00158DC82B|nr:pyridine nucleotide-disulfide oxidoreductase domain-containing protein 1 [Chelonus insularis]
MDATFVVIGGGIAGVSCVEGLSFLESDEKTILISANALVKTVTNVIPLGKTIMKFDVAEKDFQSIMDRNSSLSVINDVVTLVDTKEKIVETQRGVKIKFKKLCLCTGAKPRIIYDNPYVLGIRDTESVETFSKKIINARKIIVVGNGGIATEIVHEVENVEIIWVIKDKHISATFFDPGAAEFFKDKLLKNTPKDTGEENICKRFKYTVIGSKKDSNNVGAALGPDWHESFVMKGQKNNSTKVDIEYECEIARILNPEEIPANSDWPVHVELTNGKVIGCDFIVSATGVIPNTDIKGLEELKRGDDGGFLVDWKLETSVNDIYAAGDVCSAGWDLAEQWFQMRLWTQAHQMGRYAAKSMASTLRGDEFFQDFCFELFSHVTTFFGYKVVLLGLYNGQKLEKNHEILLRLTKNLEYIKLVIKDGKLQGAVLIGETDLEEMCENLILNQLDVSIYGEDLLNPNIDIEDYFD